MKSVIVLLPVLALTCYARAPFYTPWTYPVSEPATFQEMNSYQGYPPQAVEQGMLSYESDSDYGPVQEQAVLGAEMDAYDYPISETIPVNIQQSQTTETISVNSLTSGAVEAVYKTPNKGRVSLYLRNGQNDILLVIDARVDWYTWKNILVLNSKLASGQWQQEVHPTGFPFPCCGYVTIITLRVEISDAAFIISANGIEIVKYPYREGLRPPVTSIEYVFEDTGASKKAELESLSIDY